ncbi:MAG: DHHA1 domain-containing protein [Thermotaleaceae bacterium]
MTKKLFYEDVYVKDFTANITDIVEKDDKFHIILDQTAFYPEGGGQPSDIGLIDDIKIEYVYEEGDMIYHVAKQRPTHFIAASCSIDWRHRFDHMQQHLGQHILSGCFEKLFQGETIGFHLGNEFVTIDIAMDNLLDTRAEEVEFMANQIIYNNLPVKQLYPDPEKLQQLPLRKPPKVKENIRIIEVEQFDYSPCGGTHPHYTGEVGLIKVRKWEKMKGALRIEFVCGNRALKDYYWKNNGINKISTLLSVKDLEAAESVERLYKEHNLLKKELRISKNQLTDYEAAFLYEEGKVHKDIKILAKVFDPKDMNELRTLAAKIATRPKIILLFGSKQNGKAQILFSRSQDVDINMNELLKEVSPMINGKGGGNPQTAQGGGDDLSNLEGALQAAEKILIHRYL